MFKKRKQKANIRRKRPNEDDEDDDEKQTDIQTVETAPSKKIKPSALSASTSTTSDKNSIMHTFSNSDANESSSGRKSGKELATATAEYTEDVTKAKHDREREGGSDVTLEGRNQQKKPPRNKFLAGPLRAPSFVRSTCVFDYQPNICKDYKETGFCGFGDSCIYLHDRGDTIAGWQLEAQWEEKKKKEERKKERQMNKFLMSMGTDEDDHDNSTSSDIENDLDNDSESTSNTENFPYACHICRKPFADPVVTICGHYFCEVCITKKFQQVSPSCPVCKKDLQGIFNYPVRLYAKRKRMGCKDWEDFAKRKM